MLLGDELGRSNMSVESAVAQDIFPRIRKLAFRVGKVFGLLGSDGSGLSFVGRDSEKSATLPSVGPHERRRGRQWMVKRGGENHRRAAIYRRMGIAG